MRTSRAFLSGRPFLCAAFVSMVATSVAASKHADLAKHAVIRKLLGTFTYWPICLYRGENVMLSTILIIILILLLIGALPTWPYSAGWGYYPGGGLGLILIIVIILVLMGRI